MEGQVLQSHIDRAAGRGRKGVEFEDRNQSWLPRASRAVRDPAPIRSRKAKGKTEKEGSGLVHRFISSMTNLFPQDLVLREHPALNLRI